MSHYTSEEFIAAESCDTIDWLWKGLPQNRGKSSAFVSVSGQHRFRPFRQWRWYPHELSVHAVACGGIVCGIQAKWEAARASIAGTFSTHPTTGHRLELQVDRTHFYADRALYIITHATEGMFGKVRLRSTTSLMATRDFETGVNILGGVSAAYGGAALAIYGDVLRRVNTSLTYRGFEDFIISLRLRGNAITYHGTDLEGGMMYRTLSMPFGIHASVSRGDASIGVTSCSSGWSGPVYWCCGLSTDVSSGFLARWPRPFLNVVSG